jgi:hypothetical protein
VLRCVALAEQVSLLGSRTANFDLFLCCRRRYITQHNISCFQGFFYHSNSAKEEFGKEYDKSRESNQLPLPVYSCDWKLHALKNVFVVSRYDAISG